MKKAKIAVEILVMMIVAVLTATLVLYLVQAGVLEVEEGPRESMLNMEFIPIQKEGILTINGFEFCSSIDEETCIESREFIRPSKVNFQVEVEISPYNDEIKLIENYQVRDAFGNVVLEVDEGTNFHYDQYSRRTTEVITLQDYFTIRDNLPPGKYTLDLIVRDVLINKKVTASEVFEVK